MSQPLRQTFLRWSKASNTIRVLEEGVASLLWLAAAGLVAVGVYRLPYLAASAGSDLGEWAEPGVRLRIGVALCITVAVAAGIVAALRYRRHRTTAEQMARRLDRGHATKDLMATALAIEAGTASGNEGLYGAIAQRAGTALPSFKRPINGFREPGSGLAAVGIAAALVALLPSHATAEAEPQSDPRAATDDAVQAPPLSEEALEALREQAQRLAQLEHRPGLRDDAREELAAARKHLEALAQNGDRSLSTLSKAERELKAAKERARNGELFDDDKLSHMSKEELAEHMMRSMERGETDSAAPMAEELARRLEDADESEMRKMARALEKALKKTPAGERASATDSAAGSPPKAGEAGAPKAGASGDPGTKAPSGDAAEKPGESGSSGASAGKDPSGGSTESGASGPESGGAAPSGKSPSSGSGSRAESEARARWRNKAEGLAEQLRSGDSGSARSDLEEMAEEMGRGRGSGSVEKSLGEALDEVRRSRSEQLSEMNGEGEGKGKGKGEGEGEGEGAGAGEGEGAGAGEGEGAGAGAGEGSGPPSLGAPFGPPGGKPGPGGGAGADNNHGPATELPDASLHGSEKVATPHNGRPQGAVRAIRRFTEGFRDTREYNDLHDKYQAIAESPSRQEEIPLTRRDYIREYFQAVRGQ